jgi:hypothetical protein
MHGYLVYIFYVLVRCIKKIWQPWFVTASVHLMQKYPAVEILFVWAHEHDLKHSLFCPSHDTGFVAPGSFISRHSAYKRHVVIK